eukprot:m.251537 g.251537  ORF g.251537 m.251537 type:complete len:52 (+) comp40336_c0_seq59:1596-1751(+)
MAICKRHIGNVDLKICFSKRRSLYVFRTFNSQPVVSSGQHACQFLQVHALY